MAKYINLRLEPESGTAFDYLINVDNVFLLQTDGVFLFSNGSGSESFPLNAGNGGSNTNQILMSTYINDLILAAKQRGGNDYFVPSKKSPVTITGFS